MSVYISYWLLQTLAMLVTAALLPKLRVTSPIGALAMVLALGAVNATIWDGALFFQIPDSATTHTLTLLLSNGVLFWVLVKLLPGIEIEGVFTAIIAPLIFTVCSLVIHMYGRDIDWQKVSQTAISYVEQWRDELKNPNQ